jgi:hypothetical protein
VVIAFSFRVPDKEKNHLLQLNKQIDNVERQYLSLSDEKKDIRKGNVGHDLEELDTEIKRRLRTEIDKSYSKTRALNDSKLVGVIKSGSCGTAPFLQIYMDCEDDPSPGEDYPDTKKHGWVGDCNVTTDYNVYLRFCIVSGNDFYATTVDYAVLYISGMYQNDVYPNHSFITRVFDNQTDHNFWGHEIDNASETLLDWNPISSLGLNIFGKNTTRLEFLYFRKTQVTDKKLPSLDIDYGVFGRFGENQGYIYTDDEDDSNPSYGDDWSLNQGWLSGSSQGFIIGGNNTTMFMSQKEHCNSYTDY